MQNHNLIFVTTNSGKVQEVVNFFKDLCPQITIEQAALEIPEIQSLDVKEVAIEKAKYAWEIIKKPLIIDDGGIYLEQYNNFPGPLAKWVFKGIGFVGFWKLAESDPRASFLCCVTYIDAKDHYQIFEGEIKGKIIKPQGAPKNKELPFTEIFVPEGQSKPYSEIKDLPEFKEIHHRYQAIKALVNARLSNLC